MGSKSSKTQTTTATPWGPQGGQLKILLNAANDYFNNGPAAQYQGSGVAPQNYMQKAATAGLTANAANLDAQATTAQTANQSLFNADDVGNNQVVSDAIAASLNPLAKQFTTQVLPALKLGGIDSGGSSSSRQGVIEANAVNDFNQTSSDLVGRLMGQFYGQGLDAKTKALSLSPGLAGMTNAGAMNLANAGDAQQMYQQLLLNDEISRFNTAENADLTHMMNFKNLITGGFGGTTTSPTGQQPGSAFGSALGGGLAAYGAGVNPVLAAGIGLSSLL